MVFAITEPDAGATPTTCTTTAGCVGSRIGDYVISGQKYYISGVDEAAAIITVARTGTDPDTGNAQLSLFLVPVDAAGSAAGTRLEVAAQIPDRQYTVFYDDVGVPASALIGVESEGWRPLFDGLNPERITAAALGVGIARYALDTAAELRPHAQRLGPTHRGPPGGGPPARRRRRSQIELARSDDGEGRLVARQRSAGR